MSFNGDLIKSGILTDGKNITVEGNIRSSNLLTTRGKIWYVHSGVGSDVASRGKLATKPFATWDYAVGKCSANRGDIIYLLPGHAEIVATAGAINPNVAGVRTTGLGEGADKPTFTFSAVDATITVSAASNIVEGILLKPSIDSVVSPIVVSAADCLIDVEVQDKTALIECVNAILTTAAADRLTINLKYRGFTAGDACVNAIRLVGVDTARINVDFYGKASIGIVEFHTTLSTDVNIVGHFWNEGTSLTKNVVETVGSNTWSVTGWDGEASANFSGGDHAALALDDTGAVNTVVDTLATRSIRANTVDLAAGDITGTTTRFTVAGGPILVRHLGMLVTTAIPAGANTLKFSFTPTGGGATDLSGATDTASAGLRQIFTVDGVKVTGLVKNADVGIGLLASEVGMPLVLGTGVIQTIFSAGAPGTGAATLFMQWEPLASASAVA